MHGPGSREAGIGQARACPARPVHTSTRDHHALGAPERQLAPSPQSSFIPLLLHRAPPPHQLATRHTRAPARAPSPSSSSTFCCQYRGRECMRPIDPVTLLPRKRDVEHRHAGGHPVSSSPCPFEHQNRRAMFDLHGHPPVTSSAINRPLRASILHTHSFSSHPCCSSTNQLVTTSPE
jgi:hypothetical protein